MIATPAVGLAIRKARREAEIRQSELADAIGMHRQFLSRVEKGVDPFPTRFLPLLPEPIRLAAIEAMIGDHEAAIAALKEMAA